MVPSTNKGKSPGVRNDTSPGNQEDGGDVDNDTDTVAVPSDDEWDDSDVSRIDVSALGTRSSARKKNQVSYTEESEVRHMSTKM